MLSVDKPRLDRRGNYADRVAIGNTPAGQPPAATAKIQGGAIATLRLRPVPPFPAVSRRLRSWPGLRGVCSRTSFPGGPIRCGSSRGNGRHAAAPASAGVGRQLEVVGRDGPDRSLGHKVGQHAADGDLPLGRVRALENLIQQIEQRSAPGRARRLRTASDDLLQPPQSRPGSTKRRRPANRGSACSWPARRAALKALRRRRAPGLRRTTFAPTDSQAACSCPTCSSRRPSETFPADRPSRRWPRGGRRGSAGGRAIGRVTVPPPVAVRRSSGNTQAGLSCAKAGQRRQGLPFAERLEPPPHVPPVATLPSFQEREHVKIPRQMSDCTIK